jgi:hypothetical protein
MLSRAKSIDIEGNEKKNKTTTTTKKQNKKKKNKKKQQIFRVHQNNRNGIYS